MFRFVTKKELWDIEDSGILQDIPQLSPWHLKNIQDAVAYKYLLPFENSTIADIGGGNSRLLRALMKRNRCVNIDKLEGVGRGPKQNYLPPEITIVSGYLGEETKELIGDEAFDAAFSISVIEHIPSSELKTFFAESARISKKNALSIHLIDIYCSEEPTNQKRAALLTDLFFEYFAPLEENILKPEEIKFSCCYATNPDYAMNSWNKSVPHLRPLRETHQSCSLILAGYRR